MAMARTKGDPDPVPKKKARTKEGRTKAEKEAADREFEEEENQEAAFEKAWREEAARRLQRIQEASKEEEGTETRFDKDWSGFMRDCKRCEIMFMFGNGGERVGKEVWGLCDDCIEELRIQKMPIVEEEG